MSGNSSSPRIVKERIAHESRKFRIVEQVLQFPDGHQETWEYAELKGRGGVQICALTGNSELIFVREFRAAVGRAVLRLPTGALERGESPKRAARRELEEETGFRAKIMELIYVQEPSGSYFKMHPSHLFFAADLRAVQTKRDSGEQGMEAVFIPLERAYEMAERAEFDSANVVYAILLLKRHLGSKETIFE